MYGSQKAKVYHFLLVYGGVKTTNLNNLWNGYKRMLVFFSNDSFLTKFRTKLLKSNS